MRIVEPSYEILVLPAREAALIAIEVAGRTCYKSEDRINPDSAAKFVRKIMEMGHESVIEHVHMTVRFVVDRGVSHELVRHRLASYSQESTRYCNYAKGKHGSEITFIRPCFWPATPDDAIDDATDVEGAFKEFDSYDQWLAAMVDAERRYMAFVEAGAKPEEARSVLPNSLKTEIVMTANVREWRHVFALRCSTAAHPQMRQVMRPLLKEVAGRVPELFGDLEEAFFSTSRVCGLPVG